MDHQVFAQVPSGVVVVDAEHGAEFREGHNVRVGSVRKKQRERKCLQAGKKMSANGKENVCNPS